MKLFVWDFHGTLEKGNELAVLEISNLILKKHGYTKHFTKSEIDILYGKKWWEYFHYLLPTQSHETHLQLQKDCISYSSNHSNLIMQYISSVDNARMVLNKISKRHDQILISNTTPESMQAYLNIMGFQNIFTKEKTFAINSHVKNISKLKTLHKYMKSKFFESIIVIGDTQEDISLGKAIGALTFLYAHPGRQFIFCNADYKINNLKELLKFI